MKKESHITPLEIRAVINPNNVKTLDDIDFRIICTDWARGSITLDEALKKLNKD